MSALHFCFAAFGSSALPSANGDNEMEERGRKKKKRSRWATSEEEKIVIPGMPTVIPANMSKEQEEQYLRKYFLEVFHVVLSNTRRCLYIFKLA